MQKINDQLLYSPSDLCLFMSSPFALWMERNQLESNTSDYEADAADEMLEALSKKGLALEDKLLKQFQEQGKQLVKIQGNSITEKLKHTQQALFDGVEVIYQAAIEMPHFGGFADFLVKVPGESKLGDYHYEVWDSKLSKYAKPTYVVQLCCYAEMLNHIQARYADSMVVMLGNGELLRFASNEFRYYYQQLKQRFLNEQASYDARCIPDPAASRDWGHWHNAAAEILHAKDHLSLVAGMTRNQVKALERAGISTASQLTNTSLDHVNKINPAVLTRLKAQAQIQKRSQGLDVPAFEILKPNEGEAVGLALLPPDSNKDLFFDIEGYPLVDGGLEYLWGCSYFDASNKRQFKEFWAHDSTQEKMAFQGFIQWAYSRWIADTSLHIYHYANYEIAACRRLMGKYGVCEHEVDELLRNEVFVDLYKIVRHGVLLGEPRYSIKNVEHLYRPKRDTDVGSGADSVVVYERWREMPDGKDFRDSKILSDIRDYNIDDCNSTQELVVWLRGQQKAHSIDFVAYREPEQTELGEVITTRIQLRNDLLDRAEEERLSQSPYAEVTEMLAWLLEFHRRQDKPSWWRLFDRMGMTEQELLVELDCLAQCQRTESPAEKPTPRARQLAYEYSFDANQEFKTPRIGGELWVLGHEGLKVKLVTIDPKAGLLTVQAKEEPPNHLSFIPFDIVRSQPIPEALEAVVQRYHENSLGDCAIVDFLLRRSPRICGHAEDTPIINASSDHPLLRQITERIINLEKSYLCIQGPPGAGKTYTGKHVIAELVRLGKKVGIASNSHKAINNLLLGVAEHCNEQGIDAHCCCTKETGSEIAEAGITIISNTHLASNVKPGCVLGTTAWGFARDDMVDQLDYLFVDEAGQVAVANLVAMSRSTSNIVIKGDQMQLGQPVQGTHPGYSGQSVLEFLLQDHATIPTNLGVFLGVTYRMHPEVNQFISEMIYEGRLETADNNHRQIISVPDDYSGVLNKDSGIIFVPVLHEGNSQASEEEVGVIKTLANQLLGRRCVDSDGKAFSLTWDQMLFMAPYNYQVNLLQQSLGEQAKVGSVDKFQGQEAPVVFISLCASDATEAPRGLGFLLNKNRLNVAISRAQNLVVIVGSPNLAVDFQGNVDDLKLLNLFSRLVEQYGVSLSEDSS